MVVRSAYGIEWKKHRGRGAPFLYPTHSIAFSGSITGAHMVEVSAMRYIYPQEDWHKKFSNEVGLFQMSNGIFLD